MANSPSVLKSLLLASRPKTLIAGISPVIIGASLAAKDAPLSMFLFCCSLFFSLFIQIGTNYANDYFDSIQGVDTEKRIGPARAVANGWLTPNAMRNAAFAFFFGAFCVSLPLIFTCGSWALLFVFTAITFGILYTGGPRPLGYLGLGDLLVLIYFGPVAVIGTYFVQQHTISWPIFLLSLSPALLSVAILTANNLRDEETDRAAGKNTLIVRFGRRFGALEYATCILLAAFLPINGGFFFPLLILPIAAPLIRKAFVFQNHEELIPLLPKTALLLIFYTLFFSIECMTQL
jgi:1,4-dihydroxy-2-naphthoate polyprenyltransferase